MTIDTDAFGGWLGNRIREARDEEDRLHELMRNCRNATPLAKEEQKEQLLFCIVRQRELEEVANAIMTFRV